MKSVPISTVDEYFAYLDRAPIKDRGWFYDTDWCLVTNEEGEFPEQLAEMTEGIPDYATTELAGRIILGLCDQGPDHPIMKRMIDMFCNPLHPTALANLIHDSTNT